ncbi:MAG: PCMD domain-containing protein, partial [Chitinophagales bacterium]
MKSIATLFLFTSLGFGAVAQTTITNGGFENWGNASPGLASEPTSWYSDKSGSSIASAGPQTCFKDSTTVHSGNYSVKVVTETYIGTAVNGVVTTGVVNAPSLTKSDGYIGTVNTSSASDDRRMPFTGRPDSLVGWYQYTSGGAGEQAKIRAILHTGDYYDPETPTTYHPDDTANRIADVTFLGSTSNVSTWTRFSVPFTYYKATSPAYIMINVTPSANQATTVTGSTLILDDLAVAYKPAGVTNVSIKEENVNVYSSCKTVYVNFVTGNDEQSVLTIFDISGKKVFSHIVMNNQFNSFRLSSLNTGVY